jgi:Limiting CO2-inducible proteins B/C beta carbonyic anhydrases
VPGDPVRAALSAHYGETVAVEDFMTWSEWALARVGFRPTNCLPVVAVCRDELMADFGRAVADVWGQPFEAGSLAGLVFLGRTGMQAALGHVPGEDGRHRFVVFCFPHIGIDEDGRVGRVQRRGMYRESSACGALASFRAELEAGERRFELDPDDVEQALLRMRLQDRVAADAIPSLPALTESARLACVEDMTRFIELARDQEPVDVAFISGVVVHLPDGVDHVADVRAEVVIDGVSVHLPH